MDSIRNGTVTPEEQCALVALLLVDERDENWAVDTRQAVRIIECATKIRVGGGKTLRQLIEKGCLRLEKNELVITASGRRLARVCKNGDEEEIWGLLQPIRPGNAPQEVKPSELGEQQNGTYPKPMAPRKGRKPGSIEGLTLRIAREHRLLEGIVGDGTTRNQCLLVFERYYPKNRVHGVLKRYLAHGLMLKTDDSPPRYTICLAVFVMPVCVDKLVNQMRLKKVPELTEQKAHELLSTIALGQNDKRTVPHAPPPRPKKPTAPTSPIAATVPKSDRTELVERLERSAARAYAARLESQRRLAELKAAREAILTTLADADRAIAQEHARADELAADERTASEAIRALTS